MPGDRNRFGGLPNLGQLSLPSSSSRRSAQRKATKSRISSSSYSPPRTPFTKKRNRALCPNFAKGLVRYPKASPAYESGPGPRARRPQQVWRATEPGPTLASVEFISAEHTTESFGLIIATNLLANAMHIIIVELAEELIQWALDR